jgi:Fe-S oxidoreductase
MVAPQPGVRGDFAACSGCSLCLLVCPVWRRTRDLRFTPHGRAKALQNGVPVAALQASADSCTLCGACEPVCPENIDLVAMTQNLRAQLPQPPLPAAHAADATIDYHGKTVLLAGRALREGGWTCDPVQIRDFATDRHRSVDDTPAGGGAG